MRNNTTLVVKHTESHVESTISITVEEKVLTFGQNEEQDM